MRTIYVLIVFALSAWIAAGQPTKVAANIPASGFRNLSRQLRAQGLPEVEKVELQDALLVIRLLSPPQQDTSLQEAKQLLPALLLAYGLVRDATIPATSLHVECSLIDGDRFEAVSTVGDLADFVEKRSSLDTFLNKAKLNRIAWQPAGGTPEEIAAALWTRGRTLLNSGKIARALPILRELEKRDPKYPKLALALALALHRTGQHVEAVPYLEAAFKEDSAVSSLPIVALSLGNDLFRAGQYAEAIRVTSLFRTRPAEDKDDSTWASIWLVHVAAQVKGGSAAQAEKDAEEMTRLHPESWEAWYWLASACLSQQKWDRVIQAAAKAIERNPGHADSRYLLGLGQSAIEQYQQAVQSLDMALKLMQKEGVTPPELLFVQLSYSYAQLNDAAKLVQAAETGLAFYPQSTNLQTNYKVGYKALLIRKK